MTTIAVTHMSGRAVERAYQADRAEARAAAGSPAEARRRVWTRGGVIRYTAPALLSHCEGRRRDARDDATAEGELIDLVGRGLARRGALADDALWTPR